MNPHSPDTCPICIHIYSNGNTRAYISFSDRSESAKVNQCGSKRSFSLSLSLLFLVLQYFTRALLSRKGIAMENREHNQYQTQHCINCTRAKLNFHSKVNCTQLKLHTNYQHNLINQYIKIIVNIRIYNTIYSLSTDIIFGK